MTSSTNDHRAVTPGRPDVGLALARRRQIRRYDDLVAAVESPTCELSSGSR
jgi:hypothetical protein